VVKQKYGDVSKDGHRGGTQNIEMLRTMSIRGEIKNSVVQQTMGIAVQSKIT
jgi:hypothetical protein